MAAVSFDGVTKTYPDGTTAVNGLDLEITDSEFMVLVGPSGCGKTTALRMVAGLEDISRGVLKIGRPRVLAIHLKRPGGADRRPTTLVHGERPLHLLGRALVEVHSRRCSTRDARMTRMKDGPAWRLR